MIDLNEHEFLERLYGAKLDDFRLRESARIELDATGANGVANPLTVLKILTLSGEFHDTVIFRDVKGVKVIDFKDCIFYHELYLNDLIDSDLKFRFRNCTFHHVVEIENSTLHSLEFYHCKAANPTETNYTFNSYTGDIFIYGDEKENLYFCGRLYTDLQCKIKNLNAFNTTFNSFQIFGYINNVSFYSIECESLKVYSLELHEMNLQGQISDDKKSSKIKDLSINNQTILKDKSAVITGLEVERFIFSGLNNFGSISFKENKIQYFDLSNSLAGNFFFTNVNFYNTILDFSHSDISKSLFNNVSWPSDGKLRDCKNLNLNELNTLKDVYRQLKLVCKNQLNIVDQLKFYKNEMKVFWLISKKQDLFWGRIQDWFVVGWNKGFSDFGQNLLRPIGLLFGGHVILYFLLVGTGTFDFEIDWSFRRWDASWEAIGGYFNFINPMHKFEAKEGQGIAYLADAAIRFWSGYCIWHIIKASRKYTGD